MDYLDQQHELEKLLTSRGVADTNGTIDEINAFADHYNLNLEQLGLLYSLLRKVLNKEEKSDVFFREFSNISDDLESSDPYHIAADAEILVEKISKALSSVTAPAPVGEATLKSIPDTRPVTQEIAPAFVVESPSQEPERRTPVNLIAPESELPTPTLTPQKPEESPQALAPIAPAPENLPVVSKSPSIIAAKLNEVTTATAKNNAYPDGKDPYREAV